MITTEYLKGSVSGEQDLQGGNIYPRGENSYLHIKYSQNKPSSNGEISDVINNWIGIYADNIPEASTSYLKYQWYKIKGDIGPQGVPGPEGKSILEISKISSEGNINTYRITFTDNTFYDFDITGNTNKIEKILVNNVELEIVDKVVNIEIHKEVAVGSTEPTTNESVWIKTGKNLVDRSKLKLGYIDSWGNHVNQTASKECRSDFIEIDNTQNYSLSISNYTIIDGITHWIAIATYDKNYNFLSRKVKTESTNLTISSSELQNAKYAIVCTRFYDENIKIQFEQGNPTSYEAYVEKEVYVKNQNGAWEGFYKKEEDTGWRNLEIVNGTVYSSDQIPQIRRIGKLVQIRGALKGITAEYTTLVKIPNDCVPSQTHSFTCPGSGKRHNRFQVVLDLKTIVFNTVSIDIALTEDNWYPICTSYFVD